ncbi:MAG: hypothetical protein RLZZ200_1681 [Pseudomonadota bacterium]|jgi:iron complex outermembrane receptor protein
MRRIVIASSACLVAGSIAQAVHAATAADDTVLAEVVVTAQKRTERLQDIPVAASVLGTDILARANATDITDLNKLVPSVQMKGTYNGRVPLGMRGVSTNANEGAIGLTSGVAIQVDGVPVPADSFAANALDDIAQVEVLKGPQGTLGGRTASAGVINIVTNGPSRDFKGKVSVMETDDREQRMNLAVSGPMSDSMSYSLAGFHSRTQYLPYNTLTESHARSVNYGGRAKFRLELGEDFDATLMYRQSHFHSDGGTFTYQYITPGTGLFPYIPSEFGPNGPTYFGIRPEVALPGINVRYGNTDYSSIVGDMFADWQDKDASLVLNYRHGGWTFGSVTAFQQENQGYSQDVTLSSLYFFDVLTGGHAPHWGNIQTLSEGVRQVSQEFKLSSDPSDPVSFLGGLFYSSNSVTMDVLRTFVGAPQSKRTFTNTKSYAAYGRVTAKFNDTQSVVVGLRYNKDELTFDRTQYFNPAAGQFQGCGTAIPQSCVLPTNTDSSNALVGDVSFQQKFGTGSMAYVTLSRGYKPKAFNTAFDFTINAAQPTISSLTLPATGQEHINSLEAGIKASLLDRRATLNVSAFHTTYNDYQVQIFQGGQVLAPLILQNAGKARTQGVEADFVAQATANTRVGLSAAFIDAKFLRFKDAPCYGGQTVGCVGGLQDLSGTSMPDSPKFKANLDLDHRIPLSDGRDVALGANLSYRTSSHFQANNNPYTQQPALTLLNLSAGMNFQEGKYTVTGFVNNVFDKFYLVNAEDFFSGLWGATSNAVIGQPARDAHRYMGVRVSAKF